MKATANGDDNYVLEVSGEELAYIAGLLGQVASSSICQLYDPLAMSGAVPEPVLNMLAVTDWQGEDPGPLFFRFRSK